MDSTSIINNDNFSEQSLCKFDNNGALICYTNGNQKNRSLQNLRLYTYSPGLCIENPTKMLYDKIKRRMSTC